LRAADKAIVFLYPNEQNKQGIDLLLEVLGGKVSLQFVFSPVPFAQSIGLNKVMQIWDVLKEAHQKKYQAGIGELIVIPYLTEIATADTYPIYELLAYYTFIASVIDEDTYSIRVRAAISNRVYRQAILENLQFNTLEAAKDESIYRLFQRTADFDKFLDPATCLIRGHKGVGKSTLYWLFLKHRTDAMDLSLGRGMNISFFSGHGPFLPEPSQDEFQYIDQLLISHHSTWEGFWQSYLLLRLHTEEQHHSLISTSELAQLDSLFQKVPRNMHEWQRAYSNELVEVAANSQSLTLGRDILRHLDKQLEEKGLAFWFLYDNLDEDINDEVRDRVFAGLFLFAQNFYARFKQLRLKIFLREDIWNSLAVDNKSFFNGRDLSLQWTKTDFLKLALRQASLSSKFKDALNDLSPIENIDQANEDTLGEAIQLLWGNRLESYSPSPRVSDWVYYKLCDGSITILPDSLNSTLREATRLEIQNTVNQSDDRLLSATTLDGGLIEASRERCSEMREAFPALQTFFDALSGKYPMIPASDMQSLWQQTVEGHVSYGRVFEAFIAFLRDIGLLERSTLIKDNQVVYSVASLYVDGFNMKAIDNLSL
ncbi:MAG: hypothetical protein WCD86_14550, partial [Ktedonobacteraceae bacterium]